MKSSSKFYAAYVILLVFIAVFLIAVYFYTDEYSQKVKERGSRTDGLGGLAQARSAWKRPRFEDHQKERDAMAARVRAGGISSEPVLSALASVPRHEFVAPEAAERAYEDSVVDGVAGRPVSTAEQVGRAAEALELSKTKSVLVFSAGSGYEAAVLWHLTPHVDVIEPERAVSAVVRKLLRGLGYKGVAIRTSSSPRARRRQGPFDAVLAIDGTEEVVEELKSQLKPGGRMVVWGGAGSSVFEVFEADASAVKDSAGDR